MAEIIYSEQMADVISRLRRAVNDTEEEEDFSSFELYGYISDAVDELELGEYAQGIYVKDGEFLNSKDKKAVIPRGERMVYVIKAHILMKTSLKDRADRENFSLRKNKLSVDTSKQSGDHEKTIEILEKRLSKTIRRVRFQKISGVRVE